MSWTTSGDVRVQVQRLWDSGDLLRAAFSEGDARFPIRLTLRTPSARDVSDRFEEVRVWVRALADTPHVRIVWRETKHRVQGAQRLPEAAWIESLRDAVALIGAAPKVSRFASLWHHTAATQPSLLPWMLQRPLMVLELADRWDRLLFVVAWVQVRPRPNVYLRQVDAPGVHSKFIEAHRGVLSELLDAALPSEAVDTHASGTAQFARRFGFLAKPLPIRFRSLDPTIQTLPGCERLPDITLDAASFATLALRIERVFVTENETNFLAFPEVARAIVIFGAGYGWDALARAAWLHRCCIHYWGDIDTHGFAILDQLRGYFPHASSFLMDRETLVSHRSYWGEEPDPARQNLSRLTTEEASVYDDLRLDRHQHRLRLEQERIGFDWVCRRLECISADTVP
jgi:hypothetical protein